jgi:hypothetical protein
MITLTVSAKESAQNLLNNDGSRELLGLLIKSIERVIKTNSKWGVQVEELRELIVC